MVMGTVIVDIEEGKVTKFAVEPDGSDVWTGYVQYCIGL